MISSKNNHNFNFRNNYIFISGTKEVYSSIFTYVEFKLYISCVHEKRIFIAKNTQTAPLSLKLIKTEVPVRLKKRKNIYLYIHILNIYLS